MKIPRILIVLIFLVVCLFMVGGLAMASSEGGGHGAEPKGWVATDTYRVMNFAVLFIGLFLLLRKPVKKALNSRIEGIKDQLAELEEQKKEAEKKLEEYNKKLMTLDQEKEKIIEEYLRQGNEAKQRILSEAEQTAQKLEEQAKRNIEHEFKDMKNKLQKEVLEKAIEQAEKLISKNITKDDQEKLVDEYLQKVVA